MGEPKTFVDPLDGSRFVVVAGLIGAGKTELTNAIGQALGWKVAHEPVEENPYLPLFYQDMARWGLEMQLFFLGHRFQKHQKIVADGGQWIQDRSIYEDVAFYLNLEASGLVQPLWRRDTYRRLFRTMGHFLADPDLVLYLDVTPEEALERIHLRGRACEQDIPLSYLQGLREQYEGLMSRLERRTTVMRVAWGGPVQNLGQATQGLIAVLRHWSASYEPGVFARRVSTTGGGHAD